MKIEKPNFIHHAWCNHAGCSFTRNAVEVARYMVNREDDDELRTKHLMRIMRWKNKKRKRSMQKYNQVILN